MAYDLHGGWERKTGQNAPLHPRGAEHGAEKQLNVVSTLSYCSFAFSFFDTIFTLILIEKRRKQTSEYTSIPGPNVI